jgi:N-acetylmuramic acid 6-phosphate etherase
LTAFTAHSIAQAYRDFLPTPVDEVIVSGGGALNLTLLKMLRDLLAPARVITVDEMGLASEAKEAVAFALLGYETVHHRAGNLPAATGATHPVILGNLTPGSSPISNLDTQSSNLTEATNPATADIDALPTLDLLRRINAADARVALAVQDELPRIAQVLDAAAERMRKGGRLIYVGAGTSGRLGILDAAEMPPTFSVSPEQVIGLIAGGDRAITQAVEGAEDDPNAGALDIRKLNVSGQDSVIGVSASGRAPYVLGAMREAKARGAFIASIACNRPSPVEEIAEVSIALLVGPEVIAGSTRLKAGTAQKMTLNLISTGVMIRLGKTYGNLMVDLKASNSKLRDRAKRIVAQAANISADAAGDLLAKCDGEVKTAIVVSRAGVPVNVARKRLEDAGKSVRKALQKIDN